ncbi:lysozyme inhibitor LprI family protein [Achromobacter deleyi]|uniref:lysozyme inhibitor LprI family protein n=1 Tax=Achromobacter deleyi TaxID=1353891 RepID=UPI0014656E10|nr:lysozyme inhibitor LprI family protein [Achromobacter deleyi]CAB3915315.1 hypothetical protein LMG3412_04969 [Achromobacter deleyi]
MRRFSPCLFAALPLALAAFAAPAAAAGMDCGRARTPAEIAICADPGLYALDAELGTTYGKLRAAQPQQADALRQTQRGWLKQRDLCRADAACLRARYEARVADLQGQLARVQAYQPDDIDRLALADLRQAVDAARANDPEFPLEKTLETLSVKTGTTTFANVRDKDSDDAAHFPTARPDGVTDDEWRALQASGLEVEAEGGNVGYTLMDLDGDGRRDLVIDAYVGGTGLFSDVSAWRRDGARFVPADVGNADGDAGSSLYTINGRGANQEGTWIRLRDRVYVAYRVGAYGQDRVYLMRPLHRIGDVPTLTVRYRYGMSVPKQQKLDNGATRTLDDTLHAELTRSLKGIDTSQVREAYSGEEPLCPMPPGVSQDDRDSYYSFGAGHYSYEIVGDMAVYVGQRCHIGRVVDWFGSYNKDGLAAQLWIRDPGPDGKEQTFDLTGKRNVIKTDTSIGPVVGDNG